MRVAVAAASLALLWVGCSAPLRLMRMLTGTPTPTITRTLEPTLLPTLTPRPSRTPRPTLSPSPPPTIDLGPTPSPFPTFAIPTLSPTATALRPLDCRLEWQSPADGYGLKEQVLFTAGWKVTNTGTESWPPGSVEFTYVGGAKLHRDPVVQLEAGVPPGGSVILTVDMKSPINSTLYTTYWSLRREDTFFCRVSVSIYVK